MGEIQGHFGVQYRSYIRYVHYVDASYWLVADDTVHKGDIKSHKTDEKHIFLRCTFLHQYFDFKKLAHFTQHHLKNSVGWFKKSQYWWRNVHDQFVSFFGMYLLLDIPYFRCSLVHPRKYQAIIYYTITSWINIIWSGRMSSTFTEGLLLFYHRDHI